MAEDSSDMTINSSQEKSRLLQEQENGSSSSMGMGHFNVSLSQQQRQRQQRPTKKLFTLPNLIYLAGLYALFSKTKSRCTPPKSFVADEYPTPSSNDNDSTQYRIPKIIHQSYKSLSTLPTDWADTPPRWKKLHPTYEYKFWGDDDNRALIQQYYPWFLDTYDSYPAPIQRADAARYFAVLHYGGIYADMDILPIRNVDALLYRMNLPENSDKEMIVAETYNLGLTNALFASIPNSTILHQFVKELPLHTRPLYGFEMFIPHFAVLLSTGPTRLWIYLNQYRSKIVTLNPAGWGQCHQCKQKQCTPVEGSFFETRRGGSWHKWDTRIMNFIFCHVHFCIWGGICALLGVYYKCCLGKKRRKTMNKEENEKEDWGDIEDDSAGNDQERQKDVTGKRRKLITLSMFGSLENAMFAMRILLSQHRLPMFCGIILLLIL